MPSLGFGELILVLIIALVIFGPGKLPGVGKAVGGAIREFNQAKNNILSDENRPEAEKNSVDSKKA